MISLGNLDIVYAKTYYENGKIVAETLEEHTSLLLKNLELLKERYYEEIKRVLEKENYNSEKFWEILKIAALYHDLGKINSLFQNKIRELLGKEKIESRFSQEIPHNFLSPALLPKETLSKKIAEYEDIFTLIYAIIYHHYRDLDFNEEYFKDYIKEEVLNKVDHLSWVKKYDENFGNSESLGNEYLWLLRDRGKIENLEKKLKFIMLKGLLYRLDHSSSAHVEIEKERIRNCEKLLISYLIKKPNSIGLKPFQKKAIHLRDKNILLVAPTGSGKTEFAVNWIGNDKAVYTLPLRVSVNAMYERLKEIFGKDKIGLLHGDCAYYGLDEIRTLENDFQEHLHHVTSSRQLSYPITVSTADQIFISFFHFPGYEKIFSIFPYTKIVVDEPQAYTSESLAVIVEGLKRIDNVGGKFCLMSATFYPILRNELQDISEIIEVEASNNSSHFIRYYPEKDIEDMISEIIENYKKGKKVLVITNTVKKAQSIYNLLRSNKELKVNLLHSRFIWKDRNMKEKQIFLDEKSHAPCIWISTQIVEASLDIDFDILFSELAPLDTLIQRMGRVYRKREYSEDIPNIVIAGSLGKPSGKSHVYDSALIDATHNILSEINTKKLDERIKKMLVERLYSLEQLANTKYYKKFRDYQKLLKLEYKAENKLEAERIFRRISNIEAIPVEVYENNKEKLLEIQEKIYSKDALKKLQGLRELKDLTVNIPLEIKDYAQNLISLEKDLELRIFLINLNYDTELGLLPDKNTENII
ncbi:CRISPR-associated helicase/endonuclease Cas3 [Dictyoglomus thermophilum]|uniref:CRISPR-associated helicase Cas3 n=1 Tax=Dictyoglomus thermophilum (strain ATCC 35947 / DSM 3960 / H-6-12) TaxID=309799 RepID=B5YAX8_DICT6|nr:CRISPR-associated helicase/endonuclease Cas3 [Dictyoglomus thermophilum]ACI19282.1 CRISPR-associated helicase Cas3 [Dictyoglomus thermophilum H-6-12]